MDHPCHKCGQAVEDGKPFCVNCRSPQIRVTILQPDAAAVEASRSAPLSDIASAPISLHTLLAPTQIVWPRALRVCLFAAGVAVLFTALRVVVPMLSLLGSGILAVVFYRLRNPAWIPAFRSGAQLGALCGCIFSTILGLCGALMLVLLQSGGELSQQMNDALHQAASHSSDPQVQIVLDSLKTPNALAGKMFFGMLFLSLIAIVLGGLSGALTAALLGRKRSGF